MRPIQLVMSAFGSYGREETIDFSKLGGEIFLITGDTGAGKTTIFDAIMYALYGKTSGGERDGSMMRSQFASPDAKTFVRYEFSYGNEKYIVERNPEYTVEVTLKNGTVKNRKVAQNVELTLPDNSIFLGKKSETDAKIESIIGLTSEQFTQMAMIAQGDFLKLIYAKSDERKKIFTKLFGTGFYNKIQEELRRRSNEMDDAIEENKRSAEQDFYRKIVPEGFTKEENEAEESTAEDILKDYLSYGKSKEKELSIACEKGKKTLQELNVRVAKAEETEKTFVMLEKAQKREQELISIAKEQEKCKKTLMQAEKAELVSQAEAILAETKKAMTKNQKEQKELLESRQELSTAIALYDKIKKWIELCKKAKLSQEIGKKLSSYQKAQKNLDKLQKNWEKTTEESIQCAEIYNAKYRIFLQEQAGILAKNLENAKPCPVCGSTEHPNPAKLALEAVSEQEVQTAKEMREQAEQLRQEAENNYRIKAENLKTEWIQLAELFSTEWKCQPENAEDAGSILEKTVSEIEAELLEYNDTFSENKVWENFHRKFSKNPVIADMETMAEGIYQEMLSKGGRIQGELESKKSQETEFLKKIRKEDKQYKQSIVDAGFADEDEYHKGILSKRQQEKLRLDIKKYEEDCQKNAGELKSLKTQVRGRERADIAELKRNYRETDSEQRKLDKEKQEMHTANITNADVLDRLQKAAEKAIKLQEEDAVIKVLYRTANGRLTQSVKMDLETYVQRQYFRQIIRQANKRFLVMTNHQFMLQIKEEMTGKGKNEGLDLQVYSLVTGSIRDVKTLSGGESFLAALSMALGLSDIVKQNAGGIHLEMMFIDEGFGSLDGESRKKAIEVLDELSGGNRMIGIISHVTELKEQMEKKLLVTRNEKGSSICWENS